MWGAWNFKQLKILCLILPIDKIWLVCHVQSSRQRLYRTITSGELSGGEQGVKDLHAHMLLLLVCTTIPRLGKVYIEVESENQR